MALGRQAPKRIAREQGAFGQRVAGLRAVGGVLARRFGLALVQLGELAGGVVAVALDAAVKADFLREVVCSVIAELVDAGLAQRVMGLPQVASTQAMPERATGKWQPDG